MTQIELMAIGGVGGGIIDVDRLPNTASHSAAKFLQPPVSKLNIQEVFEMVLKRHEVPMVRQGGSPVCWAACAMMLMQYKRNRTIRSDELGILGDPRNSSLPGAPDQYAILRRWGFLTARSSEVRIPFSPAERRTARQRRRTMVSPTTMDSIPMHARSAHQQTPETPETSQQSASDVLISMLQVLGPVILNHDCGSFSYGNGRPPPVGRHAVLITGVDTARNVFYFNNPWGQSNVMTSISSIQGSILRWEGRPGNMAFSYLE